MRQRDRKLTTLAALCRPASPTARELLQLASVVELTEFPAGAVVAAAGSPAGWRTRVLAGQVASTVPLELHGPGSLLAHRPDTALVALTDVALLTVAERDVPLVTATVPSLLASNAARKELLP